MADINVTEEIININVTEEVITIEAPTGGYPTPSTVYSVFGRTGAVVATEGDYTLTQLGDVTIATPSNGQVLRYNGTAWVNATESFAGTVTSVDMSVPTGLTISGNPITTSGTLAVGLGAGYVIPTQAALDAKQDDLNGTGIVKSTAGTITYLSDNTANWNTAYNDSIVSASVTGTATKTLTLNQQDGGSVTASWTDTDTGLTSVGLSMPSAFSVANSPLTANGTLSVTGAGTTAQYVRGDGSLATFPVIAQEAQRLITEVYNSTGATLAKGSIVYINGGQGNLPTVTKAIATGDATSAQTYGVVQSDITNMNNGFVVAMGSLTDLDTQIYPVGTQLYLSGTTAGAWTSVKPYAPLHLVYVGIVVRSHPTQGVVEIRIQNGYELDELHDVSAQSPTNGDILQYVAATDLWTKAAGTTTNIAEGTRLYFTDARARAAISLTTTGTSGASTYNNTTGVLNIPQYQGVLTNPVTGTGTTNTLPKFTGASTIGNSNVSDSGTLITLGSNSSINGQLVIGGSIEAGFNLIVNKTITGGVNAIGVYQKGIVQSDVTGVGFGFNNQLGTQATTFTISQYRHYSTNQQTLGAGSSIGIQIGFQADNTLTGATTNYGFRGLIPSGTNRWNIYMDGTANNYMAGSLGIGTTTLTNHSLSLGKAITGSTISTGINNQGQVLSDVTGAAYYNTTFANTQASSFTLGSIVHYFAQQGTFGAGSAVSVQVGFGANASLIGATNNYGFRGQIPVGTNRWNLYMDGTAANYLAGDTGIGTTTLGTATQLTIGGTETAVSAIARGQLINTTLVAAANSDVLVGLDIAPTFTAGAFTGVTPYNLRISAPSTNGYSIFLTGNASINGSNQILLLRSGANVFSASSVETTVSSVGASTPLKFSLNSNATIVGQFFGTTGNFTLQNGGTFTDAGFRLDVNGTTRFIGTASSDTAALGSELAAVTGTGTNWTLAGTNLNVGGYTHTVGSTAPLTTALAAVNGTYYQIAYTITGRTAGTITIAYGGTTTTVSATGASGPLATSTAVLSITPTTDFDGTIVLSIKTIGTSSASSTFANSASTSNIEVRASSTTNNTFIGLNAGRRNTTSTFNTFFGASAGQNNTTGGTNTFIGQNSGQANTIASNNTFLGAGSGQNNITGGNNTFVGAATAQLNTTGGNNTAVGQFALLNNTTGSFNVVLGSSALFTNTIGNNNIAIGPSAGRFIANGTTFNTNSNTSIFIGENTKPLADGQSNQIVIGVNTIGLGSNTTTIGTTATTLTALYGDLVLGSTTPVASALLTMNSTTEGFLPPRMTTTQKNAIASPATGLVVFDTTLNGIGVYDSTAWRQLATTTQLNTYLPLAGGTMTGPIIGTTSTFTNAGSGIGVEITNSSTGDGLKINHSAGRALNIQSTGANFGIIINNSTTSTSIPFTIQKQGTNVVTMTDAGAATFSSSVTAQGGATIFSTTSDLQLLIGNGSRDMFISGATAAGTSQMIGIQNISGANRVNLYDGKLVITSGGNVGIGTSSPAYPLQVRRAGGGGSLGISIDSVGATDRAVQYFAIQDSASGAGAGHAFYYRTPSSTTDTLGLLLNEDGNVGIGTSSPSSLLTVAGATDLAWSAGTSKLQILRSGSQARINNYESGSGSSIAIGWDGGNVLIGTTTDSGNKLDVTGIGRFVNADQGAARVIIQNTGSGGQAVNLVAGNPNVDQTGFSIAYGNTNFLRFDSSGAATFSSSVTATSFTVTDIESGVYANYFGPYSGGSSSILSFLYGSSGSVTWNNGGVKMTLSSSGTLRITTLAGTGSRAVLADSSGDLSAPVSDISVKENIKPIGYGLNEILKMNPVWFDFIDEYKNYGEGRQNGNIAQEMAEIIPEAVFTTPSTGKMGINYDQMHAVYIKAIQELKAEIEELKIK